MKISKQDALKWFTFFSELPQGEELTTRQTEIVYSVYAQIEDAAEARFDALIAQISNLKTLKGRTSFVGEARRFPKGCLSCLLGSGLSAVRRTNMCNAACRFCYDYGVIDDIAPIGEGMWEIGGAKYRLRDLDMLLSAQRRPSGIAYVYLEPFMEIELYYPVIKTFHKAGIYQHMYTNGISATRDELRALGMAGLDELRFNIGASNCSDKVIESIAVAKRYIPAVGIETPMTPETYDGILKKKQVILNTGLDFMNCAELHLNPNNIGNYMGENLYIYRHGYLSPLWSRELTLKLMKLADEEKWTIAVHDCSNRTKFARDMNIAGKERGWFGASNYFCEFDSPPFEAFLPILKDDSFEFLEEEPLPEGYRPGDLVI